MSRLDVIIASLNAIAYAGMTVFAVLLSGIVYTRATRQRHPWLNWLNGKQLKFSFGFLMFLLLYTGSTIWEHILSARRSFQVVDLSDFNGEKAMQSEFERELPGQIRTSAREATDYFRQQRRILRFTVTLMPQHCIGNHWMPFLQCLPT